LNPHGFCPPPPQDGVSTKFHHFRTIRSAPSHLIFPSKGKKRGGNLPHDKSNFLSPNLQGKEGWEVCVSEPKRASSNHLVPGCVPGCAGAGAPAGGAGAAGGAELSVCCGTSPGATPFITEDEVPLPEIRASPRDVNMNMTAAATVILCKKDVAPELPKMVWLEPPKAAPMLAPFPFWSKTIRIRAIQTAT
jgi:hypothetical protein